MPSPNNVAKAFGMVVGEEIADYPILNVSIGHVTVIRNQEYTYPMTVTLGPYGGGVKRLKKELNALLRIPVVVKSNYNNPYNVIFGKYTIENHGDGPIIIASPYAIKISKLN